MDMLEDILKFCVTVVVLSFACGAACGACKLGFNVVSSLVK